MLSWLLNMATVLACLGLNLLPDSRSTGTYAGGVSSLSEAMLPNDKTGVLLGAGIAIGETWPSATIWLPD